MKWFPLNRALLWKEWQQMKWVYLICFLLISISTVIYPLILAFVYQFADGPFWYPTAVDEWSLQLARSFQANSGNSMNLLGPLIAVGLGALALSMERWPNTMEYLVTTPVSRREIASTKWLLGAAVLIGTMMVQGLLLVAYSLIWYVHYDLFPAFAFLAVLTGTMLAMYAVSFLVSTLTGNIFSAGIAGMAVVFMPWYWFYVMGVGRGFSEGYYNPVLAVLQLVILPCNYGFGCGSYFAEKAPIFVAFLLSGAAVLLYFASLWLYQRNPLERNGRLFLFFSFWTLVKVLAPVVIALPYAYLEARGHDGIFLAVFAVAYGLQYAVLKLGELGVKRMLRTRV